MKLRSSPINKEIRDTSIEVHGFTLTETVRSAGSIIPPHYHNHTNIAFVLSGSFVETIGREAYNLTPGSIVLRPAGEPHRNQYGVEQAKCLIIEVGTQRLSLIRENFDLLDRADHIRDNVMSNLAFRIHKELRQMDDASTLSVEGLILEMLARGVRRKKRPSPKREPRWLQEARDFLHAEFSRPVTLSQIAQTVRIHPSHLAKMFRLHHRCTLGEYVRQLRLNYAENELTFFDKSLSEIALSAGFYDQSHFSNAFKLHYGLTPSEFRVLAQTRKASSK